MRYETIRMLVALAAEMELTIDHLDVPTAFLNGELKEVVYMEVPEGVNVCNEGDSVCLLRKAIYGLKQSSRTWYEKCAIECWVQEI